MTSSAPLQLFPHRTTVPRKSSLKKPSPSASPVTPGELKGVAIQVTAPSISSSPPTVQPADEHIKHSLFCDAESAAPGKYIQARPKRHLRTRRRSSASEPSTCSISGSPPLGGEGFDQITPLPINTNFGPTPTSPRRHAAQLKRPTAPAHISVEVLPDTDMMASPHGDRLSPLPTRDSFVGVSPMRSEYPAAMSTRSASPTLVRSNSGASMAKDVKSSPYPTGPMRSIFPQFDHTRGFQEQQYYPHMRSPTPTLPSEKVSKLGSPDCKRPDLERFDSAVALVDGYEHIPVGTKADMVAVWNASSDIFPCAGRKCQLGLHQPYAQSTSLAIGTSPDQLLYSMSKVTPSVLYKEATTQCVLAVNKHCPQKDLTQTVAQMGLPDPTRTAKERENDVVTIFPQMAAINAIEAVGNSPAAAHIATFDPTASGPEAKRLAQDAVSEAHTRHRCQLVRATRKRDSLGAVTATYQLEHPHLGTFAITVTRSTAGGARHSRDPRAKISLHHPSATPAAVAAENLILAFLDFARNSCVLDIPGLLALEGPYVIDTVVCALLAVAVIENDALMAETLTFDAPPTKPFAAPPSPKRKARSASPQGGSSDSANGRRWWGRGGGKKGKKAKREDQVELPLATEAALGLLSFSFKTAVFVLEVGVKVTAGMIVGATHLVRKL